ncbi:MAG: hypothetical protein UR26_C0001G0234 [candidate division TM6 bacterium GW2011_GWF2_32_72]|nr:MAG: hypothetical protein UR26_C0001G0234 [candidate division TM6 bacterium GW2011_GWF2_32_72]
MIDLAKFLFYISIAAILAINCLAAALSTSLANAAAIRAMEFQPSAQESINKISILGTVLLETSVILSLVMTIILLFGDTTALTINIYSSIATVGLAIAVSISGAIVSIASHWPLKEACMSVARQPFFAGKIQQILLLSQSLTQSPIIFGFLIALIIKNELNNINTLDGALRYLAAGICMGVGSLGPAIGLGTFAAAACKGVGYNKRAFGKILTFTFLSEAIIETPLIFAFLISALMLTPLIKSGAIGLVAAVCMAIGTLTPGISSGNVSAQACEQISKDMENTSIYRRVSLFSQGLIDTMTIYALLISLLLIITVQF